MATRTLYLIRHGQYDFVHQPDDLGGYLTALGREQARRTAEMLSSLPISAIYCSSLRRAAETAGIIASAFSSITPKSYRQLWEIVPCIPAREADYFAIRFPDLAPEQIVLDRQAADEAFDLFFRLPETEDKQEMIVCHGNIIRYFACRVIGAPIDSWASMETHNCGITRCTIESDGRMMLVSLNDIGHLPLDVQTFM
jgi:serine/threonine-protein phosphatase PGAM5